MKFRAVAGTDIGRRKNINQDCYLVKTAYTNIGSVCMSIICDGMGGLSSGEKASQAVVSFFDNWFNNDFKCMCENPIDKGDLDSKVEILLIRANETIINYGIENSKKLGTTASIIIIINNEYYTYHVGDTKIYKYDGKLSQLTEEHSLVADKVRRGELTKAQAKISKERNILLQCIGINKVFKIHENNGVCNSKDIFLLCCDGFYNKLEDNEILTFLKNQQHSDVNSMQESLNSIIDIVKSRGETDNISGVIIKIE